MARAALALVLVLHAADGADARVTCEDALPGSMCYGNVTWAKTVGITNYSQYYTGFPISWASSRPDWQFVLYEIGRLERLGDSVSHNCSLPCGNVSEPLVQKYATTEVNRFLKKVDATKEYEPPGPTTCETAVEGDACYGNVTWAMTEGIANHSEYYKDYPVSAIDNRQSFQFVLHNLGRYGEAVGHDCPLPCEGVSGALLSSPFTLQSTRDFYASKEVVVVSDPEVKVETPSGSGSSISLPWWGWVLLLLACCCCMLLLGPICSCILCYESVAWLLPVDKTKAKKSKRAVKVPDERKEAAPEPRELTLQPVSTTSQAMPVYTAVPTAAPVYAAPSPVTYATPVVSTMAAPLSYAAAPGPVFYAPGPATSYATGPAVMSATRPAMMMVAQDYPGEMNPFR